MSGVKRIVASVVLLGAAGGGAASLVQTETTRVPFQTVGMSSPPEQQMVSYTIDADTVGNWSTLNAGDNFEDISGKPTGTVEAPSPTEDYPIVYVSLLQDDISRAGGGEDVLVLGKKDTLEFSATNTARSSLAGLLVVFGVTLEQTLRAYDLFPEHPKFADLVAIYAEQKGIPTDEATLNKIGALEGEIAIAVVNQVKQGAELSNPVLLTTAQQP